jgi:hypothetical protein
MLSHGTCQRVLAVSASFQPAARCGDLDGVGYTIDCRRPLDRPAPNLEAIPAYRLRGSGEQ